MIEKFIHSIIGQKLLGKLPFLRQFIRFALVGIINTIIDFGVYLLLTRIVILTNNHNYLLANAIAFITAATNSYFLNKYWTFLNSEKENEVYQYCKFVLFNFLGLVIVEAILYLLVYYFGVYDIFAKMIAMLFNVWLMFYLTRKFVFREMKRF
ncbi:MAG: hypothetical protein COU22_00275 [Candidatus Komeilibacteria bacterium CG10_big_fil_rev_8_21_14_0_10_41_13]|uniref:GtrA/DPMS transmembrane domain-containing protein n=1 Tax=Candidatus Komeilibacteria bacterium CG10_big_fil_rev_8_21_14_0_10_41_13 TaxID=1974476 RepID=A0A2M6WDA7_9BACT|nr:MAG: hypothetical protein COU22_00275 [Candidatus Komeilibacteria bacterium CG10_big_fil_rev_8_21_14_0_10_41_13]